MGQSRHRMFVGTLAALVLILAHAGHVAAQPAVDLYGVPLPPGAIARLRAVGWRHQRHDEGIQQVRITPDGRWIATLGGDMRFWDAATGKLVKPAEGDKSW